MSNKKAHLKNQEKLKVYLAKVEKNGKHNAQSVSAASEVNRRWTSSDKHSTLR